MIKYALFKVIMLWQRGNIPSAEDLQQLRELLRKETSWQFQEPKELTIEKVNLINGESAIRITKEKDSSGSNFFKLVKNIFTLSSGSSIISNKEVYINKLEEQNV